MQAARQNERARATELFHAILEQDPDHEEALLWLAALAEDPEHSVAHLQRVLDINPNSARALAGLQWAEERTRAPEAPFAAPIQPTWGGPVELVPLEPERTRWRLSTVVGLMGGLFVVGALTWWASSVFPIVRPVRSQTTATDTAPSAPPSPTATKPPPATTAHLPSPLPSTVTAAVLVGSVLHTPTLLPLTAVPTTPTATATPSPLPPSATPIAAADTVPATDARATVLATERPTPTVTLSAVPIAATVWPTPGPTTIPHTTPEPTPLSSAAVGATPALTRPGEPPFPGRG